MALLLRNGSRAVASTTTRENSFVFSSCRTKRVAAGCDLAIPDASSTNAYDQGAVDWSAPLIEASELDVGLFPEIVPSTTVVGTVTGGTFSAITSS